MPKTRTPAQQQRHHLSLFFMAIAFAVVGVIMLAQDGPAAVDAAAFSKDRLRIFLDMAIVAMWAIFAGKALGYYLQGRTDD